MCGNLLQTLTFCTFKETYLRVVSAHLVGGTCVRSIGEELLLVVPGEHGSGKVERSIRGVEILAKITRVASVVGKSGRVEPRRLTVFPHTSC